MYRSHFQEELDRHIREHGGLFNAHAHIDRFGTAPATSGLASRQFPVPETVRLWDKQGLTHRLHVGAAYTAASLERRLATFLEESAAVGVRRLDTFVDVAPAIRLDDGLGALNVALRLKERFRGAIDVRVGAYAPFGLVRDGAGYWETYSEAARRADFLASSPERDDAEFYDAEGAHLGFTAHLDHMIDLALGLGKPVHFHLDQQVNPYERGTERLVERLESGDAGTPAPAGVAEPQIFSVHCVSPSTYDAERRNGLFHRMARLNVGVICCPSAALSMRRLTFLRAPINHGVAEVFEMAVRGVTVRIGTDNVDDLFLPTTGLDPRAEVARLAEALRFYEVGVLAKLACGISLDAADRERVREHLAREDAILARHRAKLASLGFLPADSGPRPDDETVTSA